MTLIWPEINQGKGVTLFTLVEGLPKTGIRGNRVLEGEGE